VRREGHVEPRDLASLCQGRVRPCVKQLVARCELESPTGSIDVIVRPRSWSHGRRGRRPDHHLPTASKNSLAACSGELQLERGADCADWLALEAWNGAGELLAQGAQFPVIS
jgi:hypothetical protein